MKLAYSTLGCPEWSFDKILAQTRPMGYGAVEVRGISGEMRCEKIAEFKPGRQLDTLKAVKNAGFELCDFGTSVSFHDPEKREDALYEGKCAIDICHALGIPYIRVFGDRIGDNDERVIIDRVISGISELCEYAKGSGVGILQEVHGEFNRLERLQAVISGVNSESFGLIWDVAHSDKVYFDDYMSFYAPLRPYIKHIHIKDHKRENGSFTLCRVGEGDIPIKAIVKQVLSDGYDGWFSLEWEKAWHPELESADDVYPEYVKYMNGIC